MLDNMEERLRSRVAPKPLGLIAFDSDYIKRRTYTEACNTDSITSSMYTKSGYYLCHRKREVINIIKLSDADLKEAYLETKKRHQSGDPNQRTILENIGNEIRKRRLSFP